MHLNIFLIYSMKKSQIIPMFSSVFWDGQKISVSINGLKNDILYRLMDIVNPIMFSSPKPTEQEQSAKYSARR